MSLQLSAPQPLAATHIQDGFDCGDAVLGEWLKRRAMTNQLSGASRTFVVADQDSRIHGYYAMAGWGRSLAPDGNRHCASVHAGSRSGDGSRSAGG